MENYDIDFDIEFSQLDESFESHFDDGAEYFDGAFEALTGEVESDFGQVQEATKTVNVTVLEQTLLFGRGASTTAETTITEVSVRGVTYPLEDKNAVKTANSLSNSDIETLIKAFV